MKPNSRKATHKLAETNEDGRQFALCGRNSSPQQRADGTGPIIVPSIPFKHAENQCLRCYREWKGLRR